MSPRRGEDPPPSSASGGPGTLLGDERGGIVAATARFLFVVVLLGALAVGVTIVAPQVTDVVIDGYSSLDVEEPPPTGDRNPDRVDPDDPGETTYDGPTTISSNDVEDFVHHAVNDRRAEHGLEPIPWDGTIASVSRAHSVDMHERRYFDHVNPDGEGPFERYRDVANYCRGYGENIAMNWVDTHVSTSSGGVERYRTASELADGLVRQWMNSPPHREAILTDSWDRGGVGVYLADDGQVFASHNFCTER